MKCNQVDRRRNSRHGQKEKGEINIRDYLKNNNNNNKIKVKTHLYNHKKHDYSYQNNDKTRVRGTLRGHSIKIKGGHTVTHLCAKKKKNKIRIYGVLVCCWLASSLPDRTSFPVFAASSNQSVQVDSGRSGGASLCP